MSLLNRLNAPGPKRILALDGGGVRGAVTLGYLKRLESILREQSNNPRLTLSDYFDLIGGTSTGSILASCIAIGMEVDEIEKRFFEVINKIFGKKYSQWNVLPSGGAQKIVNILFSKADYDSTPIEQALQGLFGDITLGSDRFKSGLCIVTKRADTNSTWPLINHPGGKYFDSEFGRNKEIYLWRAVRASAAAPTYFTPLMINVGNGIHAAFVDGGMTMANNPSLETLMVATLKGFPFRWKLGANKLMLVSIGTGMGKYERHANEITAYQEFKWASEIPEMLMQDASWQNQIMLQWMSNSPNAWEIDGEMGTLSGDLLAPGDDGNGLLTYMRYNTILAAQELETTMGKKYSAEKIATLNQMDHAENCPELLEISSAAAKKEMLESHFPQIFAV
jgi:uncharacterized protein